MTTQQKNPPFVLRHIATEIFAAMAAIAFFASCSDSCNLKHVSSEPDSLPVRSMESPLFVSRQLGYYDIGYYTPADDTTYQAAIEYVIRLDSNEYRVSKRVYELARMHFEPEPMDFEFYGEAVEDTLIITKAVQICNK